MTDRSSHLWFICLSGSKKSEVLELHVSDAQAVKRACQAKREPKARKLERIVEDNVIL
jgi:hypothetical protein